MQKQNLILLLTDGLAIMLFWKTYVPLDFSVALKYFLRGQEEKEHQKGRSALKKTVLKISLGNSILGTGFLRIDKNWSETVRPEVFEYS